MNKTLIIYATVDGHTRKICQKISEILTSKNDDVSLVLVDDFRGNVADFDKIIVASSIRYGYHNKHIERFIEQNASVLNQKKSAFVSVNLVARKPEKSTAQTNPYVVKFLEKITWKPTKVAVFAGFLDYQIYSFSDKMLIKLIMLITKGPIRSKTPIEYTDWQKVMQFAEDFHSF